jgi:hypothetical protein
MPNPMILKIEGGGGGGVPYNQVVNSGHPTQNSYRKFIFGPRAAPNLRRDLKHRPISKSPAKSAALICGAVEIASSIQDHG